MSVLVISEHNQESITPATRSTVTAAKAFDDKVTLLVLGHQCAAVASDAAAISGVDEVICVDNTLLKHPIAETFAPLVVQLAKDFSHVIAPGNTFGKNLLPRVAALLDVSPLTDVTKIESADTFERPIYAGNAIETVKVSEPIKLLTIRPSAFDKAESGAETANIQTIEISPESSNVPTLVNQTISESERPDLGAASVVVSGGRALGSKENFALIEELADTLGGAIGASRAAVDAGFVANDLQVGQTGKVVAPDLYIAVGISGAIQHLAGMKDSKVIVAINKDEEAPIFQIADYGLVGDLFEIVPELIASLKA